MSGSLLTGTRTSEKEAPASQTLQSRIEDHWDEPDPFETGGPADLEALQGAWHTVSGRRSAEFLVSGTRFAVRFADGEIYMGVFDLNPAAAPKTMDMRIEEGPARHKSKTALCIYALESLTLRWCATNPGRSARLTAFPAETDVESLCLVFHRAQPV
jgi:uncharacterized protein (TIGR03067 family)